MSAKKSARKKPNAIPIPPATDWRTTDQDEILRRIQRARDEKHSISNPSIPDIPSSRTFAVKSPSGMNYQVEIRDLARPLVFLHLPGLPHRRPRHLQTCRGHPDLAETPPQRRIPPCRKIRIAVHRHRAPWRHARDRAEFQHQLRPPSGLLFDADGYLAHSEDSRSSRRNHFAAPVRKSASPRTSNLSLNPAAASRTPHAPPRLRNRRRLRPPPRARHAPPALSLSARGHAPPRLRERALLADEMGLGKTIQAVAACALLHHLGKAKRVLVVTPASLKAEWEEQIRKFTTLGHQLVFGPRSARMKYYADSSPPLLHHRQLRAGRHRHPRHQRAPPPRHRRAR